jgi:hypothetical protein
MAFQLSPGVNVSEVDLTTIVPSVLTTAGAYAGYFAWGPANEITQISDEITLAQKFGKPNDDSAVSFFTAANFLAYGNNLNVVRTVGPNANNATANGASVQILNESAFQYDYLTTGASNAYGAFVARYPGKLGNSLSVSVCANTSLFSSWAYASYFPSAPTTSSYVAAEGGLNDEMHVVVVDTNGSFTGTAGSILETYAFVSKAVDAINQNDGSTNYYKQVVFNQSKYVYAIDPVDYSTTHTSWGTNGTNTTFVQTPTNVTVSLSAGVDDAGSDSTTETGWALFENKDTTNISLVLTGGASTSLQNYIISNISSARQDCVAFISPPYSAVVNNSGSETTSIATWLSSLGITSTYAVADSGWKYQFDKYNNVYRWIPLNGDVAGLCVYTDGVANPWYSPAGFTRGAIKNSIKLAWNPNKTQRDTIYSAGVNPVVSFPGQGTVLFGDKTLQNKPSAFDHINVRRLFIVLEQTIAKAAQFSLFEFNDAFTQSQFVALVTPFLRSIQGGRGITAFQVVCDSTNNTQQVIDANQFVGSIFVQPARSINFVQLNFVAVGTGVNFSTVVGAV